MATSNPTDPRPSVDLELLAKAWWNAHFGYHCVGVPHHTWEERGEANQRNYREDVARFLSILVAQGFVIVSREDLQDIRDLATRAVLTSDDQSDVDAIDAALAAEPAPIEPRRI